MNEHACAPSYKRHRFPPAIIAHAVWLYFRFALSYRDVEELLAERGVIVTINGRTHYLWRAVDQDGTVLDILVQPQRDKRAAVKFLRKLLKGLAYVPRVVITDKLASYGAARRDVLPNVEHRRHKGLNNRAENSHQPTRERERRMRRFKSPGHAQRFLAAYGPIASHFRPRRHRLTATAYRETRAERFATWRAVTGTPAMA